MNFYANCWNFIFILWASTLIPFFASPVQGISVCPPAADIAPCKCAISKSHKQGDVECWGGGVTAALFTKTIDLLWTLNSKDKANVSLPWVDVSSLRIRDTVLPQLDLTPLISPSPPIHIAELTIERNQFLTHILGPPLQRQSSGTPSPPLEVTKLTITNNSKLGDDGLNLLHFSPKMEQLDLSLNKFKGTPVKNSTELLSGLSRLTALRDLNLAGNQIHQLSNGPFRSHTALDSLSLKGNQPLTLGLNAFQFNPSLSKALPLFLDLSSTGQTDKSLGSPFAPELSDLPWPIHIDLSQNGLTQLPAAVFEPFLKGGKTPYSNSLELAGNPLFCSENERWLHGKGRKIYHDSIKNAVCSNDPDYSVFTFPLDSDPGQGGEDAGLKQTIGLVAGILSILLVAVMGLAGYFWWGKRSLEAQMRGYSGLDEPILDPPGN